MLWSEPAGSTSNGVSNAFSVVMFNERVYTNIRRFVVVHVPRDKGFVYAWYVSTHHIGIQLILVQWHHDLFGTWCYEGWVHS
jgi:hypothetical protein